MFANTVHRSWRDQHSGKSSPDSYRYSSSLSSQVALDTPASEPATPAEGGPAPPPPPPLLVLPKRRGGQKQPPHIRNKSRGDERSSTSIDLSRSSIELEGLGIYTNLERDTRFHHQNRNSASNLHRSMSQISASSSVTRLGQSYVHPRRQVPTASTPQGIAQRHSVDGGYFTSVNRSLTAIGNSTLSIPDDGDDDDEDSNSITEDVETPGRASIDYRRSTPLILQRAHTDTGISSSWTPSEHLSSAELTSRAAAVRAARIAFAEKEAFKARKIEEQQKKAERRHQRSVSHITKPRPVSDKERLEQQQQQQQHRRTISEAYQPRRTSDDDIAEEHVDNAEQEEEEGVTMTTTHASPMMGPPKLPSATKHNWNKFLTWGKTRYYKAKRKVSMPVSTTPATYR